MAHPPLSFSILDWAAWSPARDDGVALTTPVGLRRRISPLSQQALNAAWKLVPAGKARIVFSSRHGEFRRTLSLFDSLAKSDNVSPADFTLSVHHALTGLLSIAQGNPAGHIAVASGQESFCYGFLEAVACLHENPAEPVLLIHCDEALPDPFAKFSTPEESPIAVALLLTAAAGGAHYHFQSHPASIPGNASHARQFIDFLESGTNELVSDGERLQWQWTRHVAA